MARGKLFGIVEAEFFYKLDVLPAAKPTA